MSCNKEEWGLEQFERNRYFYGKLLTAQDFQLEQNYFNEKRYLLNRAIHGIGIVCGLKIEENNKDNSKNPQKDNGIWSVYINKGVALDCCGREIVVGPGRRCTVNGTFKDGTNYLYIKYAECEEESVPALANASTCEESCCYNKVKEVFELEWGKAPYETYQLSGNILISNNPVGDGAVVEVWAGEVMKDITLTNENGAYSFMLKPGQYKIKASKDGYEGTTNYIELNGKTEQNIPLSLNKKTQIFTKDQGQKYFETQLQECMNCEDAKVLLAVVKLNASTLKIDPEETKKYRTIVYNNPMLYDLLSQHMDDFNNPHQVSAGQTGALVSIDGLSNPGGNVDLDKGGAITLDNTKKDSNGDPKIIISETHSPIVSGNPHHVTAAEVGAIKSIEGLSNPGGNIDLDKSGAITISTTPKTSTADPKITISENHSSIKSGNPHNVKAADIGALKTINHVSGDSKANIVLAPGSDNIIIDSKKPNELTIDSVAAINPILLDQLQTVFQYLRERALKCTVINFRELYWLDTQLTIELSDYVKKMIADKIYLKEKEEEFLEAFTGLFVSFKEYEKDKSKKYEKNLELISSGTADFNGLELVTNYLYTNDKKILEKLKKGLINLLIDEGVDKSEISNHKIKVIDRVKLKGPNTGINLYPGFINEYLFKNAIKPQKITHPLDTIDDFLLMFTNEKNENTFFIIKIRSENKIIDIYRENKAEIGAGIYERLVKIAEKIVKSPHVVYFEEFKAAINDLQDPMAIKDLLKIATAQDEVCFYAQLLKKEDHT